LKFPLLCRGFFIIIEASFVAFEVVFEKYTTALTFGDMPLTRDDRFIGEQALATFDRLKENLH
jgi:hypothetical protein